MGQSGGGTTWLVGEECGEWKPRQGRIGGEDGQWWRGEERRRAEEESRGEEGEKKRKIAREKEERKKRGRKSRDAPAVEDEE